MSSGDSRKLPPDSRLASEPISEMAVGFPLDERYSILAQPIRRGGNGIVRKAIDLQTGQFVAVKFVQHGVDAFSRRLFEREMDSLDRLRHPNIVRPLRRGLDDTGTYFLIMEWFEESLEDKLKAGLTAPWTEILSGIAIPLASAIAHAHLRQVEHRDIKPGNVLIRGDGSPVLADFGISKLRDDPSSDMTVRAFHSGVYAPPDLDDPSPWVRDVYSLGVLLVRLAHGAPIKTRDDLHVALDGLAVPPDTRRLLELCISHESDRRPSSGADLLHRLQSLSGTENRLRFSRDEAIFLKLTNRARDLLVQHSNSGQRAEAIVQADLAEQVHAGFQFDSRRGVLDQERIELVGHEFHYRLALGEDQAELVVTFLEAPKIEALEAIRERLFALGSGIRFTATWPGDEAATIRARSKFAGLLLDLQEEKQPRNAEASDELEQLFGSWMRLLDAREEYERREFPPLRFSLRQEDGREARLELEGPVAKDLTELEIDVVDLDDVRKATGVVIDHTELTLTIRSPRFFRALPKQGRIQLAFGPTQVALQRQRDAISAAHLGTAKRPELGRLIVDPGLAESPKAIQVTSWKRNLDADKQRAIQAALGTNDFLVVQGPPGTGKTAFIVELIQQELARNPEQRILLVSQTHVAVDNALARLDESGLENMVRLGRSGDPNISVATRHLAVDGQMDLWANELRGFALAHLQRYAETLSLELSDLDAALSLQEAASVSEQIARLRSHADSLDEGPATQLGVVAGGALDLAEVQGRLDELVDRRRQILERAAVSFEGRLTIDPDSTADDLRAAVDLLVGDTQEVAQLLRLMQLQAEWLQRVAVQQEMAQVFMKTRRVVAGTNLGFLSNPAVRDLSFDLCVLDEATKASATESLVPLVRAGRWVMVGDNNQLPPMEEEALHDQALMNEFSLQPGQVKETLFKRLTDRLPTSNSLTLNTQYRMIRPIGDLISQVFYEGRLKSPVLDGVLGYENFAKPVLWLDTGKLGENRYENVAGDGDRSVLNRAEADLCVQRLEQLDARFDAGLVKWGETSQPSVLVIAPYRLQVEELRRKLARRPLKRLHAEVLSVDAVQGREADFVVFSVTRSNPRGELGFLGSNYWRRINVALSRARYGLVIVGDASFCFRQPGGLRDVLDYIKKHPDDCEVREAYS